MKLDKKISLHQAFIPTFFAIGTIFFINKNVRPTSVELSRNKNNLIIDDEKIKLKNETKNAVNIKRKKIQDLNSVKGEIIDQVKKVGNGVNKVHIFFLN